MYKYAQQIKWDEGQGFNMETQGNIILHFTICCITFLLQTHPQCAWRMEWGAYSAPQIPYLKEGEVQRVQDKEQKKT